MALFKEELQSVHRQIQKMAMSKPGVSKKQLRQLADKADKIVAKYRHTRRSDKGRSSFTACQNSVQQLSEEYDSLRGCLADRETGFGEQQEEQEEASDAALRLKIQLRENALLKNAVAQTR